jgi:hypothetical protein
MCGDVAEWATGLSHDCEGNRCAQWVLSLEAHFLMCGFNAMIEVTGLSRNVGKLGALASRGCVRIGGGRGK